MNASDEPPELVELYDLVFSTIETYVSKEESWQSSQDDVESTLDRWAEDRSVAEVLWTFHRWELAINLAAWVAVDRITPRLAQCCSEHERFVQLQPLAQIPAVALDAVIQAHAKVLCRFGLDAFRGKLTGRRALKLALQDRAVGSALADSVPHSKISQTVGVSRATVYRILSRIAVSGQLTTPLRRGMFADQSASSAMRQGSSAS